LQKVFERGDAAVRLGVDRNAFARRAFPPLGTKEGQ
jgi:hypothetical protein